MKTSVTFALLFVSVLSSAQIAPKPVLTVTRSISEIEIDGVLSEDSWKNSEAISPFYNKWPIDTGYAKVQTEVKVLYNDQFLFIAAKNYQKRNDVIIQTLKRDQLEPFWSGDGFSIVIDPINQHANGFLFGTNAGGAQIEGAINLMGTWARFNENWDNKWFSATKIYDEYWTAEIAIPFTALRFKNTAGEWGINFIRNDMKGNVFSTWSPVPLQLPGLDLANLGTLRWENSFSPDKSNITLIPYLSAGLTKNQEELGATNAKANAGLDMKVALSSSLNLDVTLNPDFSNVEVDRQMTNVTRFSLLFPERRNFFLENADLFSNFGSWMVQPFFSRRIGLHEGEPVPIQAGVRLSGNATKSLRIGIMDIQTKAADSLSANNYFVMSAQQQLFGRSNIKLFAANRQTTRTLEGDTQADFNRTYGGELQYISSNGKFTSTLRGHAAQTPDRLNENQYVSAQTNYLTKQFYIGSSVEKVGENYINDLGFIPRLYNYDATNDTTVRIGHYAINPWFGLLIYPKNSRLINMIEPNTWSVVNYRSNGEFLERNTSVNVTFSFKNTAELFVDAFTTNVTLPFAADIIDSGNPIPVDNYSFTQYTARYKTDSRKALNAIVSLGYGDFYNGKRVEYGATLNLRRQPWGVFGLSYLQNDIRLPQEYGNATFRLLCPRAEVSLRNNIWWTTFLQYNTQAENFNINSRLQWRFKPMSDLFIVYTDNYATTDYKVKNRGIVVKMTWWLNL
jgi:hypothetical protein